VEQWFANAARDSVGLRSHCIEMVRGPRPRDLKALAQIHHYIRAQGTFDVIHGHSSKGGALARIAGVLTEAARVYTPHAFFTLEPELSTSARWFYARVERLLSTLAHGIICVSETERRHALSLGIPAHKLTVVQNGLSPLPDPDRDAARRQLGLCDRQICIGFVGRLAPQKSVGRLLAAFAHIAGNNPLVRLAIVGAGQERAQLRQSARQLDVKDKVIWTGEADGPALMAGFDIFVLPSRYEAFPYVLLEAAARGLPLVATRVGGAEEVIQDDVNGYIVDDEEQLSSRLLQLIRDPDRRHAMGHASLDRATAFSVDRMVAETVTLYRTLVEQAR